MISRARFTTLVSISFVFIVWFCIVFARSISPVVEGVLTADNARRMNLGPLAISFLLLPYIIITARKFYEARDHNFPLKIHKLMKGVAVFAGFFSLTLIGLTSNYDMVYNVYISVNMMISGFVAGYLLRFLYAYIIRRNFENIDISIIYIDLKDKIAFSIFIALNMTLIFINAYHILYKNMVYENEVLKVNYAVEESIGKAKGDFKKLNSSIIGKYIVVDRNGTLLSGDGSLSENYKGKFKSYLKDSHGKRYFSGKKNIYSVTQVNTGYIIVEIPLKSAFDRIYKSIFLPVIVLIILGAISISVFTIVIKRFVNAPLALLVSLVTDLAEGESDLTKRLRILSNDELGNISGKLNLFIGRVQSIIKDIAENSKTLGRSSSDMSKLSSGVSKESEEISLQSESVSGAANEMTQDMTSAAAAMEEASANLNMVATASEQMTNTINEIAGNTENARGISEEAVGQAEEVKKMVDDLSSAAQKIGSVTETITEISEQTNLLALNATIEAARAGEAGKGFNVVAGEIKALASQTAGATSEIKSNIDGIQEATQSTINEIGEITDIIAKINEIVSTIASAVEEQSVSSKEITMNVVQASEGIEEVNKGVARSSALCLEITKDIKDVNGSVTHIADSASDVNQNSSDLLQLSKMLNELVEKFKI